MPFMKINPQVIAEDDYVGSPDNGPWCLLRSGDSDATYETVAPFSRNLPRNIWSILPGHPTNA